MSKVDAIVHALTEGDLSDLWAGDEDDLKDVTFPGEWTMEIKPYSDKTFGAQYFYGGKFQGSSTGIETEELAKSRGERWVATFNALLSRRPFDIKQYPDVWSWYYGFSKTPTHFDQEVKEGLEDEDDLKDLTPDLWTVRLFFNDSLWNAQLLHQRSPYGVVAQHVDKETCLQKGEKVAAQFNQEENYAHLPMGMGRRVRHIGNHELGTITSVGSPGERWVHWDNDGGDPNSAARHQTSELELLEGLDDEDDFKLEVHNAYAKGAKVRVTTGTYAGEIGTVEGPFNWGNGEIGWWVHLDNSDDPDSAITYRVDSIEPVIMEATEFDDLRAPAFEFKQFGLAQNQVVFGVYTTDQNHEAWLGSLQADIQHGELSKWKVVFVDRLKKHVDIPVSSREEGALRLWMDFTGDNLLEAMDDDEPIENHFRLQAITPDAAIYDIFNYDKWIGRVHRKTRGFPGRTQTVYEPMWTPPKLDHPQPAFFNTPQEAAEWFWHYHYMAPDEEAVKAIIREATDDEDWEKEMVHDPILIARSALEQAGFEVETCERAGDSIVLKFSWPSPTASSKIAGFKRAVEALEPIIGKMKTGDFKVDVMLRGLHGETKTAEALIRKRLEDDPMLWKVERKSQRPLDQHSFWTIYFNGKALGEFYATSEGAERLRRELVELHRIVPFHPVGWTEEEAGDNWGNGKVIAWWRNLRDRLPPDLKVGEYHLDKSLLKKL